MGKIQSLYILSVVGDCIMKKIDRSVERALLGEKYHYFSELREQYFKALEDVREHLKENPLRPLYESHINGVLGISERGEIIIVKETLPSLKQLRVQADRYGIDISDLGRSRTKIVERIEKGLVSENRKPTPESDQEDQNKQKAQKREITSLPSKNIGKQPKDQEESDGEFDFLDEIEEEIEEEIEVQKPQQSEEEKRLLEQMLTLGNRGGKMTAFVESVDLDTLLSSEGNEDNE